MLLMQFTMYGDMGGKHDARVHLVTDDTAQPDRAVTGLSN
jgi:hypothetical protein